MKIWIHRLSSDRLFSEAVTVLSHFQMCRFLVVTWFLTQKIEESLPWINVISEGELQQGSWFLQLLHQPQTWATHVWRILLDQSPDAAEEHKPAKCSAVQHCKYSTSAVWIFFPPQLIGGLTCADQCAVVVQRSQVWARQREKSVQFGQIAAEARPRQHRANDDVPQRVANEAVGRRQTAFRQIKLSRWMEKQCLQYCWPAGRHCAIFYNTW